MQPTPENSGAVASGFTLLHLDLKLKSAVVRGLAEPPLGALPYPGGPHCRHAFLLPATPGGSQAFSGRLVSSPSRGRSWLFLT